MSLRPKNPEGGGSLIGNLSWILLIIVTVWMIRQIRADKVGVQPVPLKHSPLEDRK